MKLTDYHAKYFAHQLTRRVASDQVDKFAAALADARVDLNPHQIEAALFAFRSPLSKGAILADEVGLGKTIEAGIILAQKWAERKRKLLIILPANLRKQWSQELAEKFYLPSVILEQRTFNEAIKKGNLNPFQTTGIVICSYQFARAKAPYIKQSNWDLVVIDEAHRLRNVYKPTNKIANAIKEALAEFPKLLLTATPLQNSLLELFGLVSIIDDYTFGDLHSFKAQFSRKLDKQDFTLLRERLSPICKRTLRRQVLEYVKYTNRHALVQEFIPSEDEQKLYNLVSEYLQRPTLFALPSRNRQLMTLILRKLLASSTFAISNTLEGLAVKLDEAAKAAQPVGDIPEQIPEDVDELDELTDEWDEGEEGEKGEKQATVLTEEQKAEMKKEAETLRQFHSLAKSITKNSKGEVLLTALRNGFDAATRAQTEAGETRIQQKAIIFTESRRTQDYLFQILEKTEFKGKTVLFNGTNTDPLSKRIYQEWLEKHKGTDQVTGSPSADKRAALVEHFRNDASLMIATEAAAEGINLQFCNLVVNYDLPWNPQRIEQRIGRCHRYGQKYDVVVVNFLNRRNEADLRVYQLLGEKFKLFDGVFGASDEVLGSIESGVDFEKRIAEIYQKCRTEDQIKVEFDQLQRELDQEIGQRTDEAKDQLLSNFDQEVVEKVRVKSQETMDRYQRWLWNLTKHELDLVAEFDDKNLAFKLKRNPFAEEPIHPGPYRLGKEATTENIYRPGHPLAQRIIRNAKDKQLPSKTISFDISSSGNRFAALSPWKGKKGWLLVVKHTTESVDSTDEIIVAACDEKGAFIPLDVAEKLFELGAELGGDAAIPDGHLNSLKGMIGKEVQRRIETLSNRNTQLLSDEMDKLDRWAEDRKIALENEIKQLDVSIREAKRLGRSELTLEAKLERQREQQALEAQRHNKRKNLFDAQDEVEKRRDAILSSIEERLKQERHETPLFAVGWSLV